MGKRVLVDTWIRDWDDPHNKYKTGYFGSEADGGFADYVAIDHRQVHAVESDMSHAELATFATSWMTAEGMLNRANVGEGDRVGGLTKAARMRDIALAHGIQIYVMATGGSILADTEAAILASTIPDHICLGGWTCQDMITVDIAPGQGSRNQAGEIFAPTQPGLGVVPDETMICPPVAVYEV